MSRPRLLVVGSVNMDLVIQAPRLPRAGETLVGGGFRTVPGGKGANQAVAAARLGADVQLAGRVGADAWGEELTVKLRENSVGTRGLLVDSDEATGIAVILVEATGENRILVMPGANLAVEPGDIDVLLEDATSRFDAVLLQLEIGLDAVFHTLEEARRREIPVILDAGPAPTVPLPMEKLSGVTILSPNETEAEALTGIEIRDLEDAERAARELEETTLAKHVILKLGEKGALLRRGDGFELVRPFRVTALDTTAAGDSFTAALAVNYCSGVDLVEAVRYANAAGALAVTRVGAQSSLPTRSEVEAFLASESP